MLKLNAEELNTENLAVRLGLDGLSTEQQAEFLLDYICSLEGVFTDDVLTEAGTTFDDMLDLANRINFTVKEEMIDETV